MQADPQARIALLKEGLPLHPSDAEVLSKLISEVITANGLSELIHEHGRGVILHFAL